jgi:ribosome-associated translation inhibitor RaiA
MKLTDEEIKALRIKKKAISDDLFKAICQAMDEIREQETKKRNKRKYKW